MNFDSVRSPLTFIEALVPDKEETAALKEYESWWYSEGLGISESVDRAGTPHLRMFSEFGRRTDEILFPPEYWTMLRKGYEAGSLWRAGEGNSLKMHYLIDYVTCFFDAGLGCPYIVSMSTTVPLKKYGTTELQEKFLPHLLRRDGTNWQGATWITEVKGGSDLGANVETVARQSEHGHVGIAGESPLGARTPSSALSAKREQGSSPSVSEGTNLWLLNGDKYFASNAGAELAIVAARPAAGGPGARSVNHSQDVRTNLGPKALALYLVPRYREDGQLNYFIRRLKPKIGTRSVPTGEVELRDSEAYLLGREDWGIYLILESLNLSRVGNITGSVALAQRALADALTFAESRIAFGKPIIEHPLMRRQFQERLTELRNARALMSAAIELLDEVWPERPPYSDRYHLFRLITHLAKYWTAELAVQFAKWNMEVHGGMGVLAEYSAERLLREAVILPIWEGTPHRQMLDGLKVIERQRAHELLFDYLARYANTEELQNISLRLEEHLRLSAEEKEAGIEPLFRDLAIFTARSLASQNPDTSG
jgi:alkylation response protein AidB-like acyl-CoA dehydrogenase